MQPSGPKRTRGPACAPARFSIHVRPSSRIQQRGPSALSRSSGCGRPPPVPKPQPGLGPGIRCPAWAIFGPTRRPSIPAVDHHRTALLHFRLIKTSTAGTPQTLASIFSLPFSLTPHPFCSITDGAWPRQRRPAAPVRGGAAGTSPAGFPSFLFYYLFSLSSQLSWPQRPQQRRPWVSPAWWGKAPPDQVR